MPLNSAKLQLKLCEFSIFTLGCLVQIFTTRGVVAPPANNFIMLGNSIWSFRHLEHQNPSIISGDIGRAKSKFSIFTQGCLVQIFTTRGVVEPPGNDPITSGTLIWSFRHLELQNQFIIGHLIAVFKHLKHQNLLTGDDFISSSGLILLVQFLVTTEVVTLFANYHIM